MNPEHPDILHRAAWDRAMFWMVLLSALAHLSLLGLVLFVSPHFKLRPHVVPAYTVELVNSDQLAGTNLIPGSKGKGQAPPKVEPKPAPPPPPPPPKVEEVKQPEPPPPPKPEPKKEEPKPVQEKGVALAAATQPKLAHPTPTPVVQVKAEAKPKPEAPPKVAAKHKPEAKPAPVVAAPTPQVAKPTGPPTPTKEQLAAQARDERIAKAIEHVKQQGAGTGTGKEGTQPGGGSISVGPGQGPGAGVVMGVEYLLYRSKLEARLKEAWAWAGGNKGLEALVRFRIGEDGVISDVRITHSSGDASYDASVLRAVRAVSPLAPPPEAYRKEFSDVEITFSPTSMNM